MSLKTFLKKRFKCFSIKGKNNKLIALKNGKEYNLTRFNKYLNIQGNNNTIVIVCDKLKKVDRKLPKELKITINGNNNKIELEMPLKIKNVKIYMENDGNSFSMKSTNNKFHNANFTIVDTSSVFIGKDSEIGNGGLSVIVNHNYKIPHKVVIGDGVHIAKECLIRTSSGETFVDPDTNAPLTKPEDIIIGNNVWIMSRCMLTKGAVLADGCAVAAMSFVNKKFTQKNLLIGGTPARILRQNIKWVPKSYKKYMQEYDKEQI